MKTRQLSMVSRPQPHPDTSPVSPWREQVEHPRGPDWVHPSVYVYQTEEIGLGLASTDLIPVGSTVILFGGTLMSWREVCALPEDMQDIPFQVADSIFFGIAKREDIGIGERINHSCDPNTGFTSEMRLVAIRDILPGEQITMDYATCSSLESYRLICRCGAAQCRGIITGSDWKSPVLQRRLLAFYQPYLREKVLHQRPKGLRYSLGALFLSLGGLLSKH